jgi:hypothetical protein
MFVQPITVAVFRVLGHQADLDGLVEFESCIPRQGTPCEPRTSKVASPELAKFCKLADFRKNFATELVLTRFAITKHTL